MNNKFKKHKDDFYISLYKNNNKLKDILSYDNSQIEYAYNTIQSFFPTKISNESIEEVQKNKEIRKNIIRLFIRMIKFYGFKVKIKNNYEVSLEIDSLVNFDKKDVDMISKILIFLQIVGMYFLAYMFFLALNKLKISQKNLNIWKDNIEKNFTYIYKSLNKIYLIGSLNSFELFSKLFQTLMFSNYKNIELHISSPGGQMEILQKFVNLIVTSNKPVDIYIHKTKKYEGVASAASVLTSYCNTVTIDSNAKFMIHHSRTGDEIHADEEDIFYWMEKTGQEYDIIKDLVKEERWMSADEALNLGFVGNINFV